MAGKQRFLSAMCPIPTRWRRQVQRLQAFGVASVCWIVLANTASRCPLPMDMLASRMKSYVYVKLASGLTDELLFFARHGRAGLGLHHQDSLAASAKPDEHRLNQTELEQGHAQPFHAGSWLLN